MKSKEKKLIGVAAVLLLLVIVIRGVPLLREAYDDDLAEIEFLEQRIDRLRAIVEEAPFIADEEVRMRELVSEMGNWTFAGQDPNLIGSSVQRQLRQAVEEAGVIVRQISVQQYSETEGWLLVSQELDFAIEQEEMLHFLDLIRNSRPKLHITEFSINRNRRQFNGSITVTGFSKRQ